MRETAYYLKNLLVTEDGDSGKILVQGRDYDGVTFSGKFDMQRIKEGMLEVRIISEVNFSDWSMIMPFEGNFDEKDYSTKVRKTDIEKRDIDR